jgi:hypothetical protein
MFRSLILFAALGLSIASAKGVKNYELLLTSPAKAGTMELKAGKYNLAVMDDSTIRITDANGVAAETTATITTSDKKFDNTRVDTQNVNGAAQIQEIDLGGTKTRIQFK